MYTYSICIPWTRQTCPSTQFRQKILKCYVVVAAAFFVFVLFLRFVLFVCLFNVGGGYCCYFWRGVVCLFLRGLKGLICFG